MQDATTRVRPPRRRGFSLAELMISIGILGIGLAMAASLFPAALKENERSANDVIGSIICQNAINECKLSLKSTDITGTDLQTLPPYDPGNPSQLYPAGPAVGVADANKYLGYFLLGRKIDTATDNCQIVAIAYRKVATGDTVTVSPVTITYGPSGDKQQIQGSSEFRVGSPVIIKGTGEWATITSVSGSTAYLNRQLSTDLTNPTGAFVVVESNQPMLSPAIAVMDSKANPSS